MNASTPLEINHRLLVIDDNRAIHDDFRKILSRQDPLEAAEASLFGKQTSVSFEIDSAYQGEEGLALAQRALAEGRPYAMAFIDVRMPPGWDGVETTKRIWEVYSDLQVVICTAYSDYSWSELSEAVGRLDRLLILKKPFDVVEVVQLAHTLTEKWRLLQASRRTVSELEQAVAERTSELEAGRIAALNMMEDAVEAQKQAVVANEGLKSQMTERAQLEDQLRQSQKMEAIGQLAGGIAHDFNNILGCIMGYTELASTELSDPAAVRENLQEVLKASGRATELVKQILAFSRQQEQERQPMQLQPVIQEALKLLRASLPATINIQADIDALAATVLADASQIHQIVMNLATNAAHAMSGHPGQLGIKLSTMEIKPDFARTHPDLRVGPYITLSVTDTGCGMKPETLKRIFEPFFTTKAPGEGTGLGLAVVHGIMKSHGGAISVDSEPGRGTVFHLYFPACQSAANDIAAETSSIPQGKGERVLFVDDEVSLAFLAKKMLERAGYRVTTKTSSLEALAEFRAEPGRYDLVMTDLSMPNMTGADLAGELLKLRPGLPIVLATGFGGAMNSAKAHALGIRELLLKPATAQSLTECAYRVLSQKEKKL